ncbi:sigma factor G inhibitor Gin [Gottfriedia luciferensis]|uniref:sigma factor G inhibitor Gin n=1 Tax=Gottfriedia luciferensis TaxID=178774 RepID=UPI001F402475|nr:sigma factor G inhibitor Gin [Gottfriedia luciferensis]
MNVSTKCVVCEENKEQGIHIIQAFICDECEKKIVATETDAPLYQSFVEKLKSINTIKEEIVN